MIFPAPTGGPESTRARGTDGQAARGESPRCIRAAMHPAALGATRGSTTGCKATPRQGRSPGGHERGVEKRSVAGGVHVTVEGAAQFVHATGEPVHLAVDHQHACGGHQTGARPDHGRDSRHDVEGCHESRIPRSGGWLQPGPDRRQAQKPSHGAPPPAVRIRHSPSRQPGVPL